jgi:hypothetical protein
MYVEKARIEFYAGYNDDNILVPGLATVSQESENKDENTIHLEACLRQAYLDCRAASDIRNNLAGVYLVGDYAVVLEVRKCILRYRNIKDNVLNRQAFRYGTTLVRDLRTVKVPENRHVGIILHTQDDELYALAQEGALGFSQHPIDAPLGPLIGDYRPDVDGFDIYQILGLHGQNHAYEMGLVPMDDPDRTIHISTAPFRK